MNLQLDPTYHYIQAESDLEDCIRKLRRSSKVALDTEADSLHHYFEKICLIQLSIDEDNYIIDPLSDLDLTMFLQVLAEKRLILHGADYDLRMLQASFAFRPGVGVFDTMIAAQTLGYEQFGLAALVQRFFGVSLSKKGQKSDWSKRPLSTTQLNYACNDTRYLQPLADRLQGELAGLGRLAWFRETCETMIQAALRQKAERDPEGMWRIKGWTKLEQRQLLFLRELWRWRDHEARRIDAPPFRILNNQQLLDLAVRAEATSKKNIRDAFPLLVKFKSRRRSSLLAAVKKAQSMPQRLWPERSLRKRVWHDRSDCRVEVEAMQAECARVAAQLGMAPSFVASRATLERIVRHGARTMDEMISKGPLLRWQAELLAPRLLPLLKTFTTHTDADENH